MKKIIFEKKSEFKCDRILNSKHVNGNANRNYEHNGVI